MASGQNPSSFIQVDLGIEVKIQNIERTERAKRDLLAKGEISTGEMKQITAQHRWISFSVSVCLSNLMILHPTPGSQASTPPSAQTVEWRLKCLELLTSRTGRGRRTCSGGEGGGKQLKQA